MGNKGPGNPSSDKIINKDKQDARAACLKDMLEFQFC